MAQSTCYHSRSVTIDKCSTSSVRLPTNITTSPAVSPFALATQNKKKTACYPLATPVCVELASPLISSRAPRTRRKDYKLRRSRKLYSAHCLLTNSLWQRPSIPRSIDNANQTRFPSTPSEYAAYRAASNAPSINTPLTHAPPCTILKHPRPQTIIPSLSLSLGLHRIPSSSLPSSATGTSDNCMAAPSRPIKRRRVSKSDMAEAQWWIRMYDSLAWHVKQHGSKPTCHELAFLARLEAQIRCRWYPIVEKTQTKTKSHGEPLVLSEEAMLVDVPVNDSDACQQKRMLCPTQLAAQAFLRRSHASERPLRRKRHPSPGRSALRCELKLAS